MAVANRTKREISLKIVCLDTDPGSDGSAGERTLSFIHSRLKPELKGGMRRTPLGGGELLHADFRLPPVPGFDRTTFVCHLYAPMGTGGDPQLERMLLKGADGVIVSVDPSRNTPEEVAGRLESIRTIQGPGRPALLPVHLQLLTPEGERGVSFPSPPGVEVSPVSPLSGDGITSLFSRLVGTITAQVPPLGEETPEAAGDAHHSSPPPISVEEDDDEEETTPPPSDPEASGRQTGCGEWEFPVELPVGGEVKRLLVSIRIREEDAPPPLAGGGYVR